MSHAFRKSQIALASLGASIAILPLSYVALNTESLMLLGSFGASALLLFALPEAPLSQPRSVVCGHLIASAAALACLLLLGKTWWAVGAATGLGVGLMMLTRTVHPPAGSNAIIVFLANPSWDLLMLSTLLGTVILVSISHFYHKTTRKCLPKSGLAAPLVTASASTNTELASTELVLERDGRVAGRVSPPR